MTNILFNVMTSINKSIDLIRERVVLDHTKRKWVRIISRNISERLPAEKVKEAEEFYRPYFKLNPCFHEFYAGKTGKFDVRYFPDDMWYGVVNNYFNDKKMAAVLDNKCFYPRIFGDICKQARNIAYRMNGYWFSPELVLISENTLMGGVEHYKELVVKKATDSFGGHGVSFISQQKGSIYEQLKEIDAEIAGDIVIQAPILQHPDMAKLHKESINTIRAFSFLTKQGDVKIYSVIVRIGVGSSRVDNASSGGITCGVEKDGSIKPVAFTPKGDRFTEHPTTGFHFEQVKIPNYSNVLETIRKLHTQIPHFRFASWDIAIDQEGDPVLIEVNLRAGELDFHQLNNGPIFGEDTKTVLNEVFGQKI